MYIEIHNLNEKTNGSVFKTKCIVLGVNRSEAAKHTFMKYFSKFY